MSWTLSNELTRKNLDPNVSIEELDRILVEAIKEMDLTVGETATREEFMRARCLEVPKKGAKSVKLPDIPACDACGDDYSGTMKCTACECAYYCSRECQKMAWKKLGHKQECSTMKEKAQDIANKVVDSLTDKDLPPMGRVQLLMDNLNASGPYMYAVEYGLHEAIRECFTEDANFIVQNNSHPRRVYHCCFTHWIMMVLFRGQRTSRANTPFNRVDGGRIQAYVQAFPDDGNGFEIWWTAALQAVRLILEPVFQGRDVIENHQIARDVWSGFVLVFASTRASEAILLTHDPTKCRERAEWMLTELQEILARLWEVTDGRDRNESIQGYFNQVSAMIVAQCRILGNVDIDAPRLLKLERLTLLMYTRVAVPLAEETIRKKKLNDNKKATDVLKKANRT